MWKTKDLKRNGRRHLRRDLVAAIAVCFILAFTGTQYSSSVSVLSNLRSSPMLADNAASAPVVVESVESSNWAIVRQWIHFDTLSQSHPSLQSGEEIIRPLFDAVTLPANAVIQILGRSDMNNRINIFIAILGVLGGFWFLIWVRGPLEAGGARFFLEARAADNISIAAMFRPFHRGNWWNTTKATFRRTLFFYLWSLTLVGGVVKYYSYRMVPYIIAENPHMRAKDAMHLSRRMMNGHKWHCFLLGMNLLLFWHLIPATIEFALTLVLLTALPAHAALLGTVLSLLICLLQIIWVNSYESMIYAELYIALRQDYITREGKGREAFTESGFNDQAAPAPWQTTVPDFHFKHKHKRDYTRHYAITVLILLFFSFACAGWLWEVSLHIVTEGRFVNRGTMFGPWLPIYGYGGIMALVLLRPFFKKPIVTFGLSMAVCGAVEYFASWFLEYTKGVRWWDYSDKFMNLNGRIYLAGTLVFGFGCCAIIYFAAPLLGECFDKLSRGQRIGICTVLLGLYGSDMVYSHFHPNMGAGITDYSAWKDKQAPAAEQYVNAHIAPKLGKLTSSVHHL